MEVSNSEADLYCIEFSVIFRETRQLTKMREKLSSTYESHDKEDFRLGLEDVMHSNKVRVVSHEENIFLEFSRFNLIVL